MNFLPIIRKFFKLIAYGALTLIGLVFLFFSFFPESLESNLKQYNLDQFLSNTGDKINTFSNEITFIKPSPETLKAVNSKGIYINYPQKSMRFSLEEEIPECPFDLNTCFGFHGKGTSTLRSNEHNQQLLDRIKLLDTVDW